MPKANTSRTETTPSSKEAQRKVVTKQLTEVLWGIRSAAGLPKTFPKPALSKSEYCKAVAMYTGSGEHVDEVTHPRFGDLGRLYYCVSCSRNKDTYSNIDFRFLLVEPSVASYTNLCIFLGLFYSRTTSSSISSSLANYSNQSRDLAPRPKPRVLQAIILQLPRVRRAPPVFPRNLPLVNPLHPAPLVLVLVALSEPQPHGGL